MTTSSDLGEHPPSLPMPPGERRLTPAMLCAETAAIPFAGLPDGVRSHRQLTDTVEAALRLMGISDGAIALARNLAGRIQARDWKAGQRPICWPSNRCLEDEMSITGRHLRRLIGELGEAGALIMRDSANMKRHGRRDPHGNIITAQAFGYDLSTWATCYASFAAIVAAHKAHCDARRDAWNTAKLDKRKIDRAAAVAQATKAADLAPFTARAAALWAEMESEHATPDTSDLIRQAKTNALTALAHRMGLLRLEAVAAAAANGDNFGKSGAESTSNSNEMSAREDISVPLKNTTTNPLNSNVVQAWRGSVASPTLGDPLQPTEPAAPTARKPAEPQPNRNDETWRDRALWDGGTLKLPQVKTSAAELADLVPELQRRLGSAETTWGTVTTTLRGWAHEAGISAASIKHAETLLGWQSTFIGLAIVASKQGHHFDVSPGAYFAGGIVKRAQAGTLDLRASLWGLRQPSPAPAPTTRPTPLPVAKPAVSVAASSPPPAPRPTALPAAQTARASATNDREEEKAEIASAQAVRRTGPQQQSLAQAVIGAALPREVKRTLNAAIAATSAPPLPQPVRVAPATDDPLIAELKAAQEKRRLEEAQRVAAMTPSQRAAHDQREAQRLAVCAAYRRGER